MATAVLEREEAAQAAVEFGGPRFRVAQKDLARAAQSVAKIATSRSSLSQLQGTLVEAREGGVTLTASDLEVGLSLSLPATVERPGRLLVSAKNLAAIVAGLPAGDVEVEASRLDAVLRTATSEYRLAGMEPDLFPELPEQAEGATVLELEAAELKQAVRAVEYCASDDSTAPILTTICLRTFAGGIGFKTCDRSRFAWHVLPRAPLPESNTLIPASSLRLLVSLLEEAEPVRVCLERNQVTFRAASLTFNSRLIEGAFPIHEQRLGVPEAVATLDRQALAAAVRRARQIVQGSITHRTRWEFAGGTLTLTAESDLGRAEERLPYAGDVGRRTFGVNAAWMLSALQAGVSETVQIAPADQEKLAAPCIVRDGDGWCALSPIDLSVAAQ